MIQNNTTKIGVITATIIGMNAMIGAGIFTAPAAMAANVGPAGIIAYLFVITSIWFLAISLARLAALFPEEGSFYTYAKQWSGHIGGLIASGSYFIGLLIAMGLLCQVAGSYLHKFFPTISSQTFGLITLIGLTILNIFGVVLSKLGQHILIVCTTFPLVITTLMCLSKMDLSNLTPFAPYGYGNVFKATRAVIFGFFGFECAASLFNIVSNPQQNVPRALTYSIIVVGFLYILFVTSLILSTPLEYFTDPRAPLSDILKVTFPDNKWILTIVDFSILSALLGTVHSMIWSSSSLLVSLIKKMKSTVAQNLIKVNFINHSTAVLLVGLSILTTFVTITKVDLFFSLTATAIVTAYLLSIITLLTIKSEWQSGQNIKTILGIITTACILFFALEGLVKEISKFA